MGGAVRLARDEHGQPGICASEFVVAQAGVGGSQVGLMGNRIQAVSSTVAPLVRTVISDSRGLFEAVLV